MDRSNDRANNFGADPSLDEIIAQQGKVPLRTCPFWHGVRVSGRGVRRGFSSGTRVARAQ